MVAYRPSSDRALERGKSLTHRYLSKPPRPWSRCLASHLAVLAVLLFGALPAAAAIRSFELSQTTTLEGTPAALRCYARVLDELNEPVFHLDGVSVSATLGERELRSRSIESFNTTAEGVAYVFLVDISRSLSLNEFGLIQASLESWISSLRSGDRAAIFAFGDESRLVADFTNDVERLRESIAALGPTDNSTVFFEALEDGLELARRRDPGLPGRRALIVLTDGRDEGSAWSVDDVLVMIKENPAPVYSIGLSRIRNQDERERYLQLLSRLSINSGGAFFEGTTENLASLYAAIREAIHNVWVLDFECADCRRDGESYRLQVNLSDGQRVLSDGQRFRLLPPAVAASTTAVPSSESDPSAGAEEAGPEADVARGAVLESEPGAGGLRWLWLLLLLPAGLAAGRLLRRKTSEPEPITAETDLSTLPAAGPVEAETFTTPTGVVTTRPPRPVKLRVVRLIVVRGKKPGRTYNLTLLDKAIVGTRSTCDCVLPDEPGVAPEQFELFQMDGHVFLRNLSDRNPTLVDGLPTEHQHRLQTEALVGTREFIVRIIFGEGRATARG